MSLVNELEITEKNLAVHRRGTRRHLRVLWVWQSVHTETTEKLYALCVGGFETRRRRRELTKQAAWGKVEPYGKSSKTRLPKEMLKMKSPLDELLKTQGRKNCSG